jgi:hypothetical protein
MCEEKRKAKTKADRLIEAMDRLSAALWWQRADPCQLNVLLPNETSQPSANESGPDLPSVRDGSGEAAVCL